MLRLHTKTELPKSFSQPLSLLTFYGKSYHSLAFLGDAQEPYPSMRHTVPVHQPSTYQHPAWIQEFLVPQPGFLTKGLCQFVVWHPSTANLETPLPLPCLGSLSTNSRSGSDLEGSRISLAVMACFLLLTTSNNRSASTTSPFCNCLTLLLLEEFLLMFPCRSWTLLC